MDYIILIIKKAFKMSNNHYSISDIEGSITIINGDEHIAFISKNDLIKLFYANQHIFTSVNELIEALENIL